MLWKLGDELRRGESAIAGQRRSRRWKILRVARVTTSDADEVVALPFEERQRRLNGSRNGAFSPAALGRWNHSQQFPFFLRRSQDTRDLRITTLGRQLLRRLSVPFGVQVGAFGKKHLDNAGRHGIRSG